MGFVASDTLIEELEAWATQPRFVFRHEWSVGDMVIWDNCGVLRRVTLAGDEAIA